MINYIKGDLLTSDERIIAHGCNAQGVMGSGIAKAIRDKYPKCYTVYRYYYDAIGLHLGDTITSYEDGLDKDGLPVRIIVNCITQENYGRTGDVYVDYPAIEISLDKTFAIADMCGFKSVGLPLIGAGLGGGDWGKISTIINEASECFNIPANVYIIDDELYAKYAT